MRRAVCLLAACVAWLPARAADHLDFAPADGWVRQLDVPGGPPRDPARSLDTLLLNAQDRFGADTHDTYTEMATRLQTPQGLADIGSVELAWNPDTETPVINRLVILRDGKTIDLLATEKFTVLRRETNLENAMLDGVLTAVLEPEGLRTGDVLDFGYTIRQRDPVMHGHAESIFRNVLLRRPAHLFIKASWPATRNFRYVNGEGFAAPHVSTEQGVTSLVIDMANVEPPVIPQGAPPRYDAANQMELTDFPDWSSVASLFAPLYEAAARPGPGSALPLEVARIKAASTDKLLQASLALQSVQNNIRYVYLGVDYGNYVPAAADLTWSRRFGDCKGKTALLLALLHGLGIDATPALVSTQEGDGLPANLPSVGRFDHVMVRADIAGHVYWLDGTRSSDTSLAELAVPPFHWALPLRLPAALERLQTLPLAAPQSATTLRVDASAGLFVPAAVHGEMVLHGDNAVQFRNRASARSRADVDALLRRAWRSYGNNIDPASVGYSLDPATGDAHVTMDGKLRLDWTADAGGGGRYMLLEPSRPTYTPDFDRPAGPHPDAPFQLSFPTFMTIQEDVVLPAKGFGFTVGNANVDHRTAVAAWRRDSAIVDGVLHMHMSEQTLAAELPAADAAGLAEITRKLAMDVVYLHAGRTAPWSKADDELRDSLALSDPDELLERARHRWTRKALDPALADLDRVVSQRPGSAGMLALRGRLQVDRGDLDRADADLNAARKLDPDDTGTLDGLVRLAIKRHDYAGALATDTRLLAINPAFAGALAKRAWLYAMMQDSAHAAADFAALIKLAPTEITYRIQRWYHLVTLKQGDLALQEANAFVAEHPADAPAHLARARLFRMLERGNDAVADCQAALAIQPSAPAYLGLALSRPASDRALRLADLEQALKLDPLLLQALLLRGRLALDGKDQATAMASFTQALHDAPDDIAVLSQVQWGFFKMQRVDLAMPALDRLVTLQPANAKWRNARCWTRATSGGDAHAALTDCDAALKIEPEFPDALDSRGFVHLRLGDYAAARQDYDAALKIHPDNASSLYGRYLSSSRTGSGSTDAAQRDLKAARVADQQIETTFAGYGMRP